MCLRSALKLGEQLQQSQAKLPPVMADVPPLPRRIEPLGNPSFMPQFVTYYITTASHFLPLLPAHSDFQSGHFRLELIRAVTA